MVEMDSRLKGIILNCTLKSFSITTIEGANVFKVTMRFYRGYKNKSPSEEEVGQAQEGEVLGQVQEVLSWCQSPSYSLANPLPCYPGLTSLLGHCHYLQHTGRGSGG